MSPSLGSGLGAGGGGNGQQPPKAPTENRGVGGPPTSGRFVKGVTTNPGGRPKHRLERLARLEVEEGLSLVAYWGKLYRGEPFVEHRVQLLSPRTTKGAVRKKRYEVIAVPYYPTIADRNWASERLA